MSFRHSVLEKEEGDIIFSAVDDMGKEEVFKAPPFDEKAYVEKELFEGKRTIFMIAYCVWIALLSSLLGVIDNRYGIVLGFLGFFGIRPFLLFVGRLDMTRMKPKDWFVTLLFYVFGWLWIWLLLMQFIR